MTKKTLTLTLLALVAVSNTACESGTAIAQGREKIQQGVDYRIEAILDEDTETLLARARLHYTHNGAEPIDTLWFHQHLNAFRPNSAWATRDLEFDNRRFTDLGPNEHAFERLVSVTIDGTSVDFLYPGAPDSTVFALPLREQLNTGENVTVVLDWHARPSTTPRRQGRRGRHYDFAQWFPKVAVYDEQGWEVQPFMPQGELYGEFATFDITLDVATDQVIGATGVPMTGDPGWSDAVAPGATVAPARATFYENTAEASLGLLDDTPQAGRKRVRWHAENVHHFAWSTNPDYVYEGGTHGDVSIHILYQPGDEGEWGGGVAVERTANALEWLGTVFDSYPYPQVTNVHRIEGGGTEFPMMVMNGSASQGLITHEVGHIYVYGILANNEWKDAWMDEGLISFATNWYFEETEGATGIWQPTLGRMAEFENRVTPQPVATPAADFLDPGSYGTYSYTKGSVIFYMLRELMGWDNFRQAMQLYYRDNAFEHVTEDDLRLAVETVHGGDLSWFFDQWLHTTGRLDFALRSADAVQQDGGGWRTEVTVSRTGSIWMPVTVQVGDARVELVSHDTVQVANVETAERPQEVVLDPDMALLESSRENNTLVVTIRSANR